jgi:drug/metabolite transporter (DMT)-like permease
VQLLFASLAIAGRFVLPHFPAGALVCFRVLGATAVLLLVNAATGGGWIRDGRHLLRLALLGLLYLQPLFAAAVAPLLLEYEQITTRTAVAGLAIFLGLGLVILAEVRQHRGIPLAPVGE